MRAVEVRLHDHRVVGVVERDQLVALVGERGPSLLEVAVDLGLPVEHVARGDQLVARVVERLHRDVELVPVLGLHVLDDELLPLAREGPSWGAWLDPTADPARRSRDRSSAGAEWVSAPTEMYSTPVAAISATFSRVIPPEASSFAPPVASRSATAARMSSGPMLSRRSRSALGRERLADLVEVCALDLHRESGARRARGLDRRVDAAREREVVLLDQERVVEAHAVVACRRPRRPRPSRAPAGPASSCGCRGSSRRSPPTRAT